MAVLNAWCSNADHRYHSERKSDLEDDDRVTLVLTTGESAANQAIAIPKGCIVGREELVVKRRRNEARQARAK